MAILDFLRQKPETNNINRSSSSDGMSISIMSNPVHRKQIENGNAGKYFFSKTESVTFNRGLKRVLDDTAAAWKPVFLNDQGAKVDDAPEMEYLDKPYVNYTRNDLIKQFCKQKLLYGVVIVKITPTIKTEQIRPDLTTTRQGYEFRIIDADLFEKIIYNTDTGYIETLKYKDTRQGTLDMEGVAVYVDAKILDGWNREEVYINDIRNTLERNFLIERNLRDMFLDKITKVSDPTIFVSTGENLSKKQREDMEKKADDKNYTVGRFIVLTGGDVKQVSSEIMPKEYLDIRDSNEDEILDIVGVSKDILNITGNASGVLYDAVLQNYYRSVVENYIISLTEFFNNDLIPKLGVTNPNILSYEDPFPQTEQQMEDKLLARKQNNIITTNEYREKIEYPPIPDGDTLNRPDF